MNAREAQRLAEFIAFGPVIFQTARIMLSNGIMDMLRDSDNGMTIEEIAEKAELSVYAAKCLLEASLCIGLVLLMTRPTDSAFRKRAGFCSMIRQQE